ncbi:DUF3800 domain-containing protein [Clostridium tyrobutyricum]|uniref:DUF3800 domain-containing protein n=1 Tax=Clostridium tyrobutyricum TaxID=1519 RepID=UPI0009BE2514|nr:DUF3800 domain-containing protein [Clostridium tyrobutyricum]MBV4417052.1 DUF3800 domain-containing protein [Clostridium tyrobutyricum]MBV4441375.1 DUF3800 domain-containing protein [Clostridium tyrobutyricum]
MINVYCDESCHLEHDNQKSMVLGAVWCNEDMINEINQAIVAIKLKYNIKRYAEIKWTKVSNSKIEFYKELVEYFFKNEYLHFRGLVIPDKSVLNHKMFSQTHDQWYYKMYFDMLKVIIEPNKEYNIYLDIKDDRSASKTQKLWDVLSNNIYDFNHEIIKKIQIVRSHECIILQIADLIMGALGYFHRGEFDSNSKYEIVELIKKLSGYSLEKTTLYREDKFNLLIWNGNGED